MLIGSIFATASSYPAASAQKNKKERKEKLSIYLAKNPNIADFDLLKLENSNPSIELSISGLDTARLYIKKEPPKHSPPWTQLFTSRPEVPFDAFGNSSSVGAALCVTAHQNKFLLTFGTGFHLLQEEAIERDFGLRVTLNSVDPDKLRSLDKSSYDHNPLNSRTQSTKEVDIFDLHIDSDLEMLYAVTGISTVGLFGSHVTGRDALTVITSAELNELEKILEEALKRYKQKLPDSFEWVDNVNKVRDQDYIDILDLELERILCGSDFSCLWLGEPEIVDWEEQIGYSFDLYARTERHAVLELSQLISYLNNKSLPISVESLKHTSIHINDSQYHAIKSWSAYKCLYAELKYGADQFILRSSTWYKVNSEFLTAIDSSLSSLETYKHCFPIYNEDREEDYNQALTSDPLFELLDKKNIKIGGAYDKLEFCDLVRDGKDLIHVKYYRSSSTLSHLFSQGCVSAEAFVRDAEFRKKLNSKLPKSLQLADPIPRPDPAIYKIVYAIATTKKLPLELPFFSKVTLKNALKVLRGLNYSVEIIAIDIDPALKVKKKYKPK
ncbi:TIGR04141 family sporadically distributed protein [Pseudomonas koreensis]|uniref:TIGR04141 family sporadically distributed protein n=1 Tax=Pseudomonas koreensis TaxID=198620 RepID=UPI0021C6E9D9|nr:TIGR04141 family sporadically distributed protein [Pseudomonas koreensis]MCU0092204.1 TIGR04141 family sporadically distributed protein [Pseudomonas koreensis]